MGYRAAEEGTLVREFLKTKGISKAALTDIKFHGGAIEVNGQHASVRHQLRAGEELRVFFPVEERSEGMMAEDIPLYIIYEDDAVLIINKEANMSTIPSREHPQEVLPMRCYLIMISSILQVQCTS